MNPRLTQILAEQHTAELHATASRRRLASAGNRRRRDGRDAQRIGRAELRLRGLMTRTRSPRSVTPASRA